ncbi:MAG TPA: hypothetical protein VGL76_10125 [Gaiellaceae bacterium]|jgi:hypothetical protein
MSRVQTSLLAAFLAAAVLAAAGAAATSPPSEFSTTVFVAVTYNADCSFSVSVEGGPLLDSTPTGTSTATIPPGPYQVTVRTPLPDNLWNGTTCKQALFSMNGPGVTYSSVLGTDSGPYGATFNETFQPSSTYTLLDASRSNSPVTLTTTATGTSTSLLPPTPPSTAKGGSVQTPLVGSDIVPFRGSLVAMVTPANKATVMSGKKPVTKVKAGRYKVVVEDDSASGGLSVQKVHGKTRTLTSAKFTGKRTVSVTLSAGEWTFVSAHHETTLVVAA